MTLLFFAVFGMVVVLPLVGVFWGLIFTPWPFNSWEDINEIKEVN
jgi:hypothetical protein